MGLFSDMSIQDSIFADPTKENMLFGDPRSPETFETTQLKGEIDS